MALINNISLFLKTYRFYLPLVAVLLLASCSQRTSNIIDTTTSSPTGRPVKIKSTLTSTRQPTAIVPPSPTPSSTLTITIAPALTPLALTPAPTTEVTPTATETPIIPQPDVLLLIEYKDFNITCIDGIYGLHEIWRTKYPYDSAERILTSSNHIRSLLWSPNLKKIFYSQIEPTPIETTTSADGYRETRAYIEHLWVMDDDGSEQRRLSADYGGYKLIARSGEGRCSPSWFGFWGVEGVSEDGQWLGLIDPGWSILNIETGERILFSDRPEYEDNPRGLLDSVGIPERQCQVCCYTSPEDRESYQTKPCPDTRSINLWQGTPYENLQLSSIDLNRFGHPEHYKIAAYYLSTEHHEELYGVNSP